MSIGEFDTDSAALQQRINSHAAFGKHELNDWLFEELDVRPGMNVLELGCGTGKQTRRVVECLNGEGSATSIDMSAESIGHVSTYIAEQNIGALVRAGIGDMDALPAWVTGRRYDRVVSSYALYYTQAPEALFATIRGLTTDGGVFFFCGPSSENNAELRQFHYRLAGQDQYPRTVPAAFMEDTGPDLARTHFREVHVTTFENPLEFTSAEALIQYWRSYNLFDPKIEQEFVAAAQTHFKSSTTFTTVKRAQGVRCVA